MPEPHAYTKGQRINLDAIVVEASDSGMPVIDLGGFRVAVERRALDAADTNPHRLPTREELDRAELAKHQG